MLVEKSSSVQGEWLDKKTVVTGDSIRIETEAKEEPNPRGQKEDSTQLVCKVLVKGKSRKAINIAINSPSKNALVDTYGKDTKEWVGKVFTAHVEKVVVGGKRGTALYLIPEGMIMKESDDGFLYIGHADSESGKPLEKKSEEEGSVGDVEVGDIPF